VSARVEARHREAAHTMRVKFHMVNSSYDDDERDIAQAIADAEAAGFVRGMEKAAEIAESHICKSADDILCQGYNCPWFIAAAIRAAKEQP
jgi:hypothetical protein